MVGQRKQIDSSSLSLVARFLNHASEAEGITQAKLAEKLPDASTATVSRWFSDKLTPTEEDLRGISRILNIPYETFLALRLIDTMGEMQPGLASSAAARFMAQGNTKTILLAGMTMLAGAVFFRDVSLEGKTLLLQTINPTSKKARAFEDEADGWESGSLRLSWLTTLSIASVQARRSKKSTIRLWTRDTWDVISDTFKTGQIAANDWVALEAKTLTHKKPQFTVHFYGDTYWEERITPFMDHLASGNTGEHDSLVYDSKWTKTDPRNKAFEKDYLKKTLDSIDPGSIT